MLTFVLTPSRPRGSSEEVRQGGSTVGADYLAKMGAGGEGIMHPSATSVSHAGRQVNQRAQEEWQSAWETAVATRSGWYFRARVIVPLHRTGPTLRLERRDLGILLQIRTGHGHFADYHERFHHQDAEIYCTCGQRTAPLHPLVCREHRAHHALLRDGRGQRFSDEALLNDKAGIRALLAFAKATGAYERRSGVQANGGRDVAQMELLR